MGIKVRAAIGLFLTAADVSAGTEAGDGWKAHERLASQLYDARKFTLPRNGCVCLQDPSTYVKLLLPPNLLTRVYRHLYVHFTGATLYTS